MEGLFEFCSSLTLVQFVGYFWPFMLIDMIRYVFLDGILIGLYMLRRNNSAAEERAARSELYRQRPLVSVIAPGKNEGQHLEKLVASLDSQTYRHLELIIVDDGSDDDTPHIGRRLLRNGKISRFIRNDVRGGKASAANTGLQYAKGQYILHMDTDSHLQTDAIEQLLIPFYLDARVGAVGGDVRVANDNINFATRLQTIEYLKTVTVGRTASTQLGILRIISGACGMFRRDLIDRLRGWDVGPGLDGDITLKIRKLGYRVVHQPMALCFTSVPDGFRRLARQRYRWDRSLVRFRLRKHFDLLKPTASFRWSNFFSILENILFNVFFDIKWFIYLISMLILAPAYLGYVFIINYLLYLFANCIQFVVVRLLTGSSYQPRERLLPFYLPLVPIYTGIFLRAVRTYAYLMEFLHRTSYDDNWNPWKVSRVARRDKLRTGKLHRLTHLELQSSDRFYR